MKNSINIFSVEKGNTYTKEGDKLVWCNLISANLAFDKDLAHYKLHYVLQTEKGVITLDENKIHIYSKKGVEYARDYKTYLPSNNNIKTIECQDLREQYEVIVFDGVTPIRKKITPLVAHFSYDNMRWNITWDTDYDFYIDCYEDENQCVRWNRCLVREKDGTEHYVEGVFYKLRLNEQQMKAVKKFEKVCEELKKADVAFIIGAYGDPDMIKIGGDIGYFCKCCDNVYFYFDDLCGEAETMLKKFFDTYETGVTIGGEGYAIGVNPEGVRDMYGGRKDPQGRYIWDIWDEMETGIAFRGGGGYTYWISDWSEWFMTNVSTIK